MTGDEAGYEDRDEAWLTVPQLIMKSVCPGSSEVCKVK